MFSILLGALLMAGMLTNLTLAHGVADIFCQPRAWATAKHNDWIALTKHVSLYTLLAFLFSLPVAIFIGVIPLALLWILNGLTHFVVDAVTSRGNWNNWQASQVLGIDLDVAARLRFYAIAWICVDQVLHTLILSTSFILLLGLLGTFI